MESGVKVITNWVMKKVADRTFVCLDELNEALIAEVDAINQRTPFRNQQRSRRDLFDQLDTDELGELSDQVWADTVWKKSKVTPGWHITINTVKYSVPYQLIGCTVDVRIRGCLRRRREHHATHKVSIQRGTYVTDVDHCPPGLANVNNLWTPEYFIT